MNGKIAVGFVLRPHGVRGAVRVEPWLDDPEVYARIEEVFSRAEPGLRFEVASCRRGGKGVIVWKFEGIDTPEAAEALRGTIFLADRKFLDGPEEGVLYFEDFEGLEIIDEEGTPLGRVVDMFGANGNDIIVIRTPEGEELLAPATREVVLRREGERWIFRLPKFDDEN